MKNKSGSHRTIHGKNFSGYLGNIKAYNKALSTEELAAENVGATLFEEECG